jgi:hypothetical protein
MSTNSRIAILNENNSVESVYCHWDGYLSNNGNILFNHYKDEAKVRELIALGQISSLEKNVKPIGSSHSFENKETGCTVAYHRDRGEDLRIDKHISLIDWQRHSERREYNYIYIDGKWYYNDGHKKDLKALTELTEINTAETE